ncbi:MAG: preprotein translocase subunit SecG [Bacteroidetes bacterium]|nr:MAG: preprotein translocase subunit SecG [Bacteroidota bacterium]
MGLYALISVLVLLVCVLLILIVLVQNSKGGGLASNFASSNQIMGVRKTTDFLEKATWSLAIALLVLTLTSTFVIPRGQVVETRQSEIRDRIPVSRDLSTSPIEQPQPAQQQPQQPTQQEEIILD